MATATRKCSMCSDGFPREQMTIRGTMAFCCVDHMVQYGLNKGREEIKKKEFKRVTEKKKELMTRPQWYDKLQKLVNQWVLYEDQGKPCCTCGTTNPNIKYDSGHFIPQKRVDPRRFERTNIHRQCSVKCNVHGSGMRAEYRGFIVKEYGQDHLDWLEGMHNHKSLKERFSHWEDIEKEIIRYRIKLREVGIKPSV